MIIVTKMLGCYLCVSDFFELFEISIRRQRQHSFRLLLNPAVAVRLLKLSSFHILLFFPFITDYIHMKIASYIEDVSAIAVEYFRLFLCIYENS